MPSAASAKPEKAPTAEASGVPPPAAGAADNSPIRQILVIIEHKIRNLEKRKSKLISYRDLQKSGKELNADQKVAVAKYDEVDKTLEFARDMFKQVTSIAVSAERDAKKQAKKDAWVRTAAETTKIRDVLLILDCLVQMGSESARGDFLQGTNGAAKLTDEDLKILDELYPEVTPRHEPNEEGGPAFQAQVMKAAEHLYSIVDGKPKEILGTTYTHIKEIVSSVHESGYFDKIESEEQPPPPEEPAPIEAVEEEVAEPIEVQPALPMVYAPPPHTLPEPVALAPAPTVIPAPAYPLRPLPPITLQEVEHAYFTQQYAQQRPITEVIGNQNFFFLQESEIDSPAATPQLPTQASPPGPIPTQTFTNQNYMPISGRVAPEPGVMPPQPHFPPPAEMPVFPNVPHPPRTVPHHQLEHLMPQPMPHALLHDSPPEPVSVPAPTAAVAPPAEMATSEPPNAIEEEYAESPDRDSGDKPRSQGEGDGQNNRNRNRYGRPRRGQSNGFRGGRGGNRQSGDSYVGRSHNDNYGRQNNEGGYQSRQTHDDYQSQGRHNGQGRSNHYRNGENGNHHNDNGGPREKYETRDYQGGFKGRGRGGPRGPYRGGPPRASRPPPSFACKTSSAE